MCCEGFKSYHYCVVIVFLLSFATRTRCSDNVGCGLEGPGASNVVEEETGLAEGDRRPWAVEIAWKKQPDPVVRAFCDGALITPAHALTPAFCYCKFKVPQPLVPNCSARQKKIVSADFLPFLRAHLLGASSSSSNNNDSSANVRSHPSKRVKSVLLHPNYQDFTGQYDLAVVTMIGPADAALGAWPICLPIALTEKLDPSKLVTSSGEFGRGRECVTNQYGQAVVRKCIGNSNNNNYSNNSSSKMCVRDIPPPNDPVCSLVDLAGTSADINIDKVVVMEVGKENVTCGFQDRFGKSGWCHTVPDFPEGKKEATYSLIPSAECEIDTELLFQPEIELCVAHPFIWPRTGVFNKDGNEIKLVAIEQPKANMGQDNDLKVSCDGLSSGVTWSYRHDLGGGDLDLERSRRAVLVGLTSRRFGCWHDGLGRVHVLTSVHAHIDWVVDAIKAPGAELTTLRNDVIMKDEDSISLKDWDMAQTEKLLQKSSSDLVNIMVNSKAGEIRRERNHRSRQISLKDQNEIINEILDLERQSELYEALQEDFQRSLPRIGNSRKRRENPIDEVLALEEGMDRAVKAISREGNKAKNLMVGSFVAVNKPLKNRVTTWVRLSKKKARAREDRKKDSGDLLINDDVGISSNLKLANQGEGLINKKGDYERTTNTPDASLFTKCGYIKYNPYEASAGGAGPNEARNAKATETANILQSQRIRFKREDDEIDDDFDEDDESVEIKGRNRIVNGEKVHKHRPWIVAIYRGIGFKGAKAEYICTGALVTMSYIVSAAHCICVPPSRNPIEDDWTDCDQEGEKPVKGKHLAFYSFFAGLIRLDKKKTSDELKAKRIIIHPDHTLTSENSDISIIELNKELKLNKKIVPICLPGKEPALDMGLNEVFAAGWGTNAVKANLDDVPPKHKSCMTTQFGSVAFKGCTFENEDEGCYQKRPPPQDSRCPGIMKAVLKQHPRLDKVMVHWGRGKEPTKCYLPETHGRHGWCKTKGGNWGFCYSSCNEKASKPVQKTKELREVSFSRLNNSLCQSATPTFDPSIELCFGHILREPIVGILTAENKGESNKLLLRKITKQSYTGNDPVGLRDTCQGDSGGPYYQYSRKGQSGEFRGILIGVTSRGAGCAQLGHAGTATNVYEYKDWIKKTIRGSAENKTDTFKFNGANFNLDSLLLPSSSFSDIYRPQFFGPPRPPPPPPGSIFSPDFRQTAADPPLVTDNDDDDWFEDDFLADNVGNEEGDGVNLDSNYEIKGYD